MVKLKAGCLIVPALFLWRGPMTPTSARDQFFLVRDESRFLDQKYTSFGRMVKGVEVARAMAVGEPPTQPDILIGASVVADLPETERPQVFVMKSNSAAFMQILESVDIGDSVCDMAAAPTVVTAPDMLN